MSSALLLLHLGTTLLNNIFSLLHCEIRKGIFKQISWPENAVFPLKHVHPVGYSESWWWLPPWTVDQICDKHHYEVHYKDREGHGATCQREKESTEKRTWSNSGALVNANTRQPRTVLPSRPRTSTDCLSDYRDTLLPTVPGTLCPTSILSHCLRPESSSRCVCVFVCACAWHRESVCSRETPPKASTSTQRCLS